MRYRNSRGKNGDHISTCANTRFCIDESVVEVLRCLYGAVIVIALIDPTDVSWSDDLMASDEVLYTLCGKDYTSLYKYAYSMIPMISLGYSITSHKG